VASGQSSAIEIPRAALLAGGDKSETNRTA